MLIWSGGILLGLAGLWVLTGLIYLAANALRMPPPSATQLPATLALNLLPLIIVAGLPAMVGGLLLRVGLKRRRAANAPEAFT